MRKRQYFSLILSIHRQASRRVLMTQLCLAGWPILRRVAWLYRRLILRNVCLVAVIGSFGKTTTKRTVRQALGLSPDDQYPGNSKSYIALNVLRLSPRRRFVVLEVGVQGPGIMRLYARMLRPDIVVATCVGSEHHGSFKTLEVTRHEKAEMLRALSPEGLAVVNADDPHTLWMASQTRARVVTFGTSPGADFRAGGIKLDWPEGSRFDVTFDGQTLEARSQLVGEHMIHPILAGLAVATSRGFGAADCLARLSKVPATSMRLERVRLPNGAILLRDEFKSTQETIVAACRLFSQVPAKRRFMILGDISEPIGVQGESYRSIGRLFAQAADEVFVFGGAVEKYRSGARSAGFDVDRLHVLRSEMWATVDRLRETLTEGDVVLIKGRDTQRFERVTLRLMGEQVRCLRSVCYLPHRCETCPILKQGDAPAWLES